MGRRKHYKKPSGYMNVVGKRPKYYARIKVKKSFSKSGYKNYKSWTTKKEAAKHAAKIALKNAEHLERPRDAFLSGKTRTEGKRLKKKLEKLTEDELEVLLDFKRQEDLLDCKIQDLLEKAAKREKKNDHVEK